MEAKAGVTCLARMAAVDSVDRNLHNEDDEARRFGDEFSDGSSLPAAAKDDPMRIMAAGNVEVNNHYESEPKAEPSPQVLPDEVPAQDKPGLLSKVAPLVLAGAMGSGITIPAAGAIAWALGAFDKAPVSEVVDTDTHRDWEIELSGGE